MGGVYQYRATAECDACGTVVDVGPFDSVTQAVAGQLPGWMLAFGNTWGLADIYGARATLCPECMRTPVVDVLDAIGDRRAAAAAELEGPARVSHART